MVQDKRIIVTGGSRGIGLEVVRQCLASGARVAYLSRKCSSEHASLEELGEVFWVEADVGDEASAQDAVKRALSDLGGVDVLVNNAGITRDGLIFRMKLEQWDEVLRVNLTSAFFTSRVIAREMAKQRSGSIISISSVVGISGNGGQTSYAASKAGLIGFSKSLAKEVASRGVRVNVVAPGFIQTDMTEALKDEQKEAILAQVPMKTFGRPEDVAGSVLFLASDYARYITGQVLVVDGGMIA